MIEDTELLRRYVESRSQEAFAELVRRRIGLVYSVAVRLTRDTHRAEDVTQAVFTDLARKASSLRGRPVLAGWLYRSAHYAAIDVIRSEQSRAARERETQTMHEILHSDSPGPEWEKVRPVLDEVISELSEKDRDAVVLRFFDHRSFGEIAAHLRLTENAARMRVERALDKLHSLLTRRGLKSATAVLGSLLAHQASASAPASLAATVTSSSLAAAGTAGVTAAGLLQLMINSKTAMSAAAMGLALVLGTATLEVHAGRKAKAALATARGESDRLADRRRELRQSLAEVDQATAKLESSLAEARAAQATIRLRGAVTIPAAAQEAERREAEEFMNDHPEVKQAFLNKNRAEAAGRYALLFHSLGLLPAQKEEVLDLLAQRTALRFTTPGGKGLTYSPGGDFAQMQAGLRQLLGEAGFAQYQTFNLDAVQRVTELAGNLYSSPTPLTMDQANQLVEIIRAENLPVQSGRGVDDAPGRQPYVGPDYDWDAVMRKARSVLSENQLKSLEAMQSSALYEQAMAHARRQPSPANAAGAASTLRN